MPNSHDRLTDMKQFGTDPGALHADTYIPKSFTKNGPLVVVLHGSTQSAEGYDRGSGWSALADECGIALLYPEQRKTNNPISSFNWFKSGDSRRGGGEPLSIRHMIEQVVDDHCIDPSRIFVTGMSSGGAMTSVMLATYPEVFAGGAIIAGLPYRSADNLIEAMVRMKGYGGPSDHRLDKLVREASTFDGPFHQVEGPPTRVEKVDGFPRQVWCNAQEQEVIEEYIIEGMGHGTPIMAGGEEGLGEADKYMLEVGISSTRHIANFWGLTE